MLPKLDGFQICTTARVEGYKFPIMFLSAKNSGERVEGLTLGADDYLVSPLALKSFFCG